MASALVLLASNAMLARLLSPQELGAYFLAFSVVSLGSQLGSLGLGKPVVRFTAENLGLGRSHDVRRTVVLVYGLAVLGAIGVGLAYLLLGRFLEVSLFRAPALAAVTGLVAGWVAVMSLQRVLAEAFRGFHDIRLAVFFEGGLGLMTGVIFAICLGILLLSAGRSSLDVVLLLAGVSAAASVLAATWLLRGKVEALPVGDGESCLGLAEVWGVAWPSLITSFTLFAVTQADLWIMGAFRPPDEVAVYGAAAKTVVLVAMPLMVVNAVVPPLIAQMYAQGLKSELERALRTLATAVGVPSLAVLLVFVFAGGQILALVFGDYYAAGATVLALLSVGQLATVWSGSCGQVLAMTGQQTLLMVITFVCGFATVAAGVLLVGRYGATGVASAAATGLVLQNLAMWIGTRATTGMWTHAGVRDFAALLARGKAR